MHNEVTGDGMASEKKADKPKKVRYHLLDTVRGFAVVGMICYHVIFDLPSYFNIDISFVNSYPSLMTEQFIRIVFFFLSGYCCLLGKHPVKRGLTVSAAGLIVTLVSIITKVDPPIYFGVLTCIGACMLLSIPFRNIKEKKHFIILFIVGLLLFILTLHMQFGYFGPLQIPLFYFPDFLYGAKHPVMVVLTAFIGFPGEGFSSSDYFPIMPWFFLFLSGVGLYGWMGEKIKKLSVMKLRIEPFTFLGKYALWVYLLHQPLVLGILWGISMFVK